MNNILGFVTPQNTGFKVSFPVVNDSSLTNTNVTMNITWPSQLNVVTYSVSKGSFNTSTGLWDVGNLSAYEKAFITIEFLVSQLDQDSYEVSATVSGDLPEANIEDNNVDVVVYNLCDYIDGCNLDDTFINAGSNITVTGTGTQGDPFIISATVPSQGLSAVSTDATLTGDGTVGDPLKVANPYVQPDGSETILLAGSNITISGTGTQGDPYVINGSAGSGDNWGNQVVISDPTLIGSGTTGDPLRVAAPYVAPNGSETKIQSGNDITVSGTGTQADPYVITFAGSLSGDDWGNQVVESNPTLLGDGTSGNPLRVANPYTGPDGNGIYDGSDNIPASATTIVSIPATSKLRFESDAQSFEFDGTTNRVNIANGSLVANLAGILDLSTPNEISLSSDLALTLSSLTTFGVSSPFFTLSGSSATPSTITSPTVTITGNTQLSLNSNSSVRVNGVQLPLDTPSGEGLPVGTYVRVVSEAGSLAGTGGYLDAGAFSDTNGMFDISNDGDAWGINSFSTSAANPTIGSLQDNFVWDLGVNRKEFKVGSTFSTFLAFKNDSDNYSGNIVIGDSEDYDFIFGPSFNWKLRPTEASLIPSSTNTIVSADSTDIVLGDETLDISINTPDKSAATTGDALTLKADGTLEYSTIVGGGATVEVTNFEVLADVGGGNPGIRITESNGDLYNILISDIDSYIKAENSISIVEFNSSEAVFDRDSEKAVMVTDNIAGYQLDSVTVRGISGGGSADVVIKKNGAAVQTLNTVTSAAASTSSGLAEAASYGDVFTATISNTTGTLNGLVLIFEFVS